MRSLTKIYTITEYGGFVCGGLPFGAYQPLPERTFIALEEFILANRSRSDTEAIDLLSLSVRRGVGKTITARNYVGLITMKNGTVIEILPKIYGDVTESDTKRIFLEMLRTLKGVSFKEFNVSNLKPDRMNLLEIFISMFISEAAVLVKQGLKSAYNAVEGNEPFFKGKLNVQQNIKHNRISKERFYVQYDEWNVNCPENRLLKATLRFLQKQAGDSRNRMNISRLLTLFDSVDVSTDIESDFSKCVADRSMSHYQKALSWCRVFLRGNSFTAFAGSEVAIALLFPMEKIFENYVAAKLRRFIPHDAELRTQDSRYSLFDSPKAFRLRPDLVMGCGGEVVVMDTKWKLLSENAWNHGISQTDMIQMYAYGKKYNAGKVVLIYPQPENLHGGELSFSSDDGVNVKVAFVDLMQPDTSVQALVGGCE